MTSSLNLDNGGERFNICLEANGNLNFKANDGNCGGNTRVTINDDSGNVGIGTTNPQSLLQIGDGLAGGNRPWMTRGIQVAWNTDNVFLGLKDQGNDRKDSVLAWGDNTNDAFRFIFVDHVSGTPVDGKEIIRLQPNGNVGIGTTSPTQKLHVAGSICYTGSIGACSDLRYKTDIEPLENSLNKVLSMQGMRYQWNQAAFPNHGFGEEPQIGFGGQEVEAICPEVVTTDAEGYKYVDYSRLTPVLVEAIKDQQQLIEQHKSALGEALAKIAQLEVTVQTMNADS
ncbi:MAG: tail fiber domain-containing protein [Microcoleaceae cyanobacterium]